MQVKVRLRLIKLSCNFINSYYQQTIRLWINFLMKDKLSTSHLQFAYKSDSSTALCTFLVVETIQYYCSRVSSVYTLLLDATKAFDKGKYSNLFELLISRNVYPLLIRLLLIMYILNNAVVKQNGEVSGQFIMTNDVKH